MVKAACLECRRSRVRTLLWPSSFKEHSSPLTRKDPIIRSLCDREVACSASDCQGSNFESCVWRAVSSHSTYHPQEVLLAQFTLYVHKGGLKPHLFHFFGNTTLEQQNKHYLIFVHESGFNSSAAELLSPTLSGGRGAGLFNFALQK